MEQSRSPVMYLLTFAVVMTVTAARPAHATAQDVSTNIEVSPEAVAFERAFVTPGLEGLAAPTARIAFGVRRGAIQHVVATSPFAEVYGTGSERPEPFTLVMVHRFGQRAAGGVQVLSSDTPTAMAAGPLEQPFRSGPYPPILWNLGDRVRIAFGGGVQSMPMIDAGIERPTAPIGSLTIEFGDRK